MYPPHPLSPHFFSLTQAEGLSSLPSVVCPIVCFEEDGGGVVASGRASGGGRKGDGVVVVLCCYLQQR